MERRNYFDMLPLSFDPAESNKRKIDKAIETWKKNTEDLLANESDGMRRARLQAELALHEDMKLVLSAPKTRNPEAKAFKEEKIRQLETLIAIMTEGQKGSAEVTNGQIRNVAGKLRLSQSTVKDVYEKKGFTVQKAAGSDLLGNAFLAENIFTTIAGHAAALRKINEMKYPWLSKVQDLYDLACFFCGGSEKDCADYRRRQTDDLLMIMQKGAAQYASDMSASGHAFNDLFADGMTQVFNSEESRRKYDNSLKKSELASFFDLLRQAPEEFKRDRQFAESCIRTIQKRFPDFNMALALYNQEAGLKNDPFEPLEALIHVTCAACGTPAEFRTREEAQKGRCPACGAALYITCPKCKKMAPASADRCSCGFAIGEMRFFEQYKQAAIAAIRNMDLAEAKRQLDKAKNAHPGHTDLGALSRQLKEIEDQFKKPLEELTKYIDTGMYSQAQQFLEKVAASMPQLRLDAQRKTIRDKLEWARRQMPPPTDHSGEAGNRCESILLSVKDYQPAIDRLRLILPRRPLKFQAVAGSGSRLKYMLSWNTAGDSGVSYRVVRKRDGVPVNQTDGDILEKDLNALEFEDTTVRTGIRYGYAVFAERRGVYSEPAVCEVVHYADLDEDRLQVNTEDGVVRFGWVLPENAIGVRILRSSNALPQETPGSGSIVAAKRAQGNFADSGVENLHTYGYRLQCVYPSGTTYAYSRGITKTVTPQPKPKAVTNVAIRNEGTMVTVKWTAPDTFSREVEIRETSSESVRDMIGQVLPASKVNAALGRGNTFGHAPSTSGSCQFQIAGNSSVLLAVIVTAGSYAVVSGVGRVSSVTKCEIDRKNTKVAGNVLLLRLRELPMYLENIYYLMNRKTDPHQSAPWASQKDLEAGYMQVISREDYTRNGMIVIDKVPQEDLYVTVIGEYRVSGQKIYSEPSKLRVVNTPKQKITYRITWKTTGFLHSRPVAKGAKLIVECGAMETPELRLVYRVGGQIPMNIDDPQTKTIVSIPASESGYPGGRKEIGLPDGGWTAVGAGSNLRLMLADTGDSAEYELAPADLDLLKVPTDR